jgi:energy-converting hydrogenase Eha subunit B
VQEILVRFVVVVPTSEGGVGAGEQLLAADMFYVTVPEGDIVATSVAFEGRVNDPGTAGVVGTLHTIA